MASDCSSGSSASRSAAAPGIHLLDDVGDSLLVEFFEQRLLQLGIDFLERFGGDFFVERSKHRLAFRRGKVFEDLGQIRRMHGSQPLVLDAQLDAPRRVNLDHIDKLPGNAARGETARKGFEWKRAAAGL